MRSILDKSSIYHIFVVVIAVDLCLEHGYLFLVRWLRYMDVVHRQRPERHIEGRAAMSDTIIQRTREQHLVLFI